jgi:PAS domain S-box-containing protein
MSEPQDIASALPAPRLDSRSPAEKSRFRLSRYFSAVSVIGFGVVIALMMVLSYQASTRTLVMQETEQNVAIAHTLANAVWPSFSALAMRAHTIAPEALVDQIENIQLRRDVYRLTRWLNVVKIRIYSLHGQTVFSNWDAEIGVSRADDAAIGKALSGSIHSSLEFIPHFEGIDGTVRDRYLVETYLPIDNPETGERQGVLEIYADVSGEIAASRNDQLLIAGVLALCMLALYVFLMLAVRRAERIMREQQRALAESELRARTLARVVEQSRDSIVTRDLDGIITTWNRGAETIFGYTSEEAVGRSMHTLVLKDWDESQWQAWLARLRAGENMAIRGWRETKSRGRVHIVGSSGPLIDEAGRLVGDIAVSHDTTWLERAQEELRRAKEAAEAAARAKSEFLANMSHEIRTPMNGIIGMTNLALDTRLDEEQRDYLTTVKSSAEALLQIINDILDLSKIEAGKLSIETVAFNLRESLEQTVRVLAVRAHEKRLELIWSVDAAAPDALIGDPLRIRQVILNLVGNAIKFTAKGEIELQVQLEDVRDREVQLHFRVRDTGIGIAADKLNSVFEAFEQADTSTTRQFGGTGLGLSICRRLVQMMGGGVSVTSTPGAGSVFEFSLCLGIQEMQQHTPSIADGSPADAFLRQPVLVVDDNARCRALLCAYIESWGMLPTACDSAAAAMAQIATARASGRPYRLALIDGTLPDADAFTLAAGAVSDATAVILLADSTQGPELSRARANSPMQALVKPVSQSTLHDGIAVALDPLLAQPARRQIAASATASSGPHSRNLDVLLVEDNAVNRKLASRLLEKLGHRVTEAHDGAVALAMTADHAYDAILMDMQMPVMDGIAATRAIRSRERDGSHVPIIALTANAMSGDRERCIESGMDDYVSKPIEAAALVAALARVTGARAATDTTATAAANPRAAPAPGINSVPADTDADATQAINASYNRHEALTRAAADEELLAQIIDIYIEETPALVAQVGEFLQSGDHEQAFRAAHTIKGSSANLSASTVSAAAHAVELPARGGDLAAARAAYPALRHSAAALIAILVAERASARENLLCGVSS